MTSQRLIEEEPIGRGFESSSVSKRLVRSLSQKLKIKNHRNEGDEMDDTSGVLLGCLTLYGRVRGCKVGDDIGEESKDSRSRRQSSVNEEGKGYNIIICGNEEATVDCFPYLIKERFWRRNSRRLSAYEETQKNTNVNTFLPDDILELCLVRLPVTSLMNARLVCKKWRNLTKSPRFMQMRREGLFQSPWMFLFGAVKDGYCSGEIHALDVSLDVWHKIDAQILKGRFLFSVTSIGEDIYIVGGCSSLTSFGRVDKSSFKTHKDVLVFSPLTKLWRKAAPMKYSRSSPILGISQISPDRLIARNQQSRDRRFYRSRVGGISGVYEDPRSLSVRSQFGHSLGENNNSFFPVTKRYKSIGQKHENLHTKDGKSFLMIAVGGLGSWDEPLDSAEIYDSISNKWMEIQRVPLDFGVACSGVVCNGIFYVYSESDNLVGYDIERGYWVTFQTTSCPPRVHEYYPKFISCNSRLFMLSVSWCEGDGQIGRRNKAVRKLWELELVHLTWTEVSMHPDAPMDWNAAFVTDGNSIFGIEMFKIFGQVLDFVTMCNVSDNGMKWSHVSKNHVAHDLDASSCLTKTMTVLHL